MGAHNCTIINQGGKREGKNNPSLPHNGHSEPADPHAPSSGHQL